MDRRSFLTTLVASVATFALDHEKLLWVPGQKLISIPADHGIAVNSLFYRDGVLYECVRGGLEPTWLRYKHRYGKSNPGNFTSNFYLLGLPSYDFIPDFTWQRVSDEQMLKQIKQPRIIL